MNISGWWRLSRSPRRPRNGFASPEERRYGTGLSPPTSSVRTVSRRPSSASAIERVGVELFVFAGRLGTVEEEELGAEQADAVGAVAHCHAAASSREAMLATTSMGMPSVVMAGRLAASSRSSACRVVRRPCSRYCARRPARGRSRRHRRCRRRGSSCRRGRRARRRPAPTTAGMPSARARMAPWESGLPAAVTMPSTLRRVECGRLARAGRQSRGCRRASCVDSAASGRAGGRARGRRRRERRRPGPAGRDRRAPRSSPPARPRLVATRAGR